MDCRQFGCGQIGSCMTVCVTGPSGVIFKEKCVTKSKSGCGSVSVIKK